MLRKVVASLITLLYIVSCNQPKDNFEVIIPSPNNEVHVYFNLNNGEPYYLVYYSGEIIIDWSLLGYIINDEDTLTNSLVLINKKAVSLFNHNYIEGQINIDSNYNETTFTLQSNELPNYKFDIAFRVFNNGIAFRYNFPEQENINPLDIISEETEFRFWNGGLAQWQSATPDSIEQIMHKTPLNDIDIAKTPVIIKSEDGIELIIKETEQQDYPALGLSGNSEDKHRLDCLLLPLNGGMELQLPFKSTWRIIHIVDKVEKAN